MFLWLPTLLVITETAIALTWASSPPVAAIGRRWWMASLFVFGSLAIIATVWQGRQPVDETAAGAGTTISPKVSANTFDRSADAELNKQVKTLKDRVQELERARHSRAIPPETADQFIAYLKPFGSRRVVVSCIPDDLEAYNYSNQVVNLLKSGGWDATGPETTKVFGNSRSPGINVYINSDDNSDTAKILLDGFAKFNIPYQSRVTPSPAIPDPNTVELFIGTAQSRQDSAGGD